MAKHALVVAKAGSGRSCGAGKGLAPPASSPNEPNQAKKKEKANMRCVKCGALLAHVVFSHFHSGHICHVGHISVFSHLLRTFSKPFVVSIFDISGRRASTYVDIYHIAGASGGLKKRTKFSRADIFVEFRYHGANIGSSCLVSGSGTVRFGFGSKERTWRGIGGLGFELSLQDPWFL